MSGNPLLDLLILAIPAALVALWWTGSRARELAVDHARQACRQRQLQFLDQTVALSRLRLVRTGSGASGFQREYRFEFTDQGDFRDEATVTMRGHCLQSVFFPYTRDSDGNRIYVH
ncbi:MAG: DUF3301 domain-containing protein [Granulosicoccus sp.]|nr:DUF3301 domain-containing protein [Granulosicoccus sp.]